jgi:hypothetical protein
MTTRNENGRAEGNTDAKGVLAMKWFFGKSFSNWLVAFLVLIIAGTALLGEMQHRITASALSTAEDWRDIATGYKELTVEQKGIIDSILSDNATGRISRNPPAY